MSPRRHTPDRWHWPQDSPLRRREVVALAYRDVLLSVDGVTAQRLDDRCTQGGQIWIRRPVSS